MPKKLLALQTAIIAAGGVYAWSKVVLQFQTFYAKYGTYFRFKDCTYPNPLVTACFYGAVAFVVAFIWSMIILQSAEQKIKSEKYLRWFLLFGICFAFSVLCFEFILYYKIYRPAGPIIACAPGVFPLKTPCFVGFLFFILSFSVSTYIVKTTKTQTPEIK